MSEAERIETEIEIRVPDGYSEMARLDVYLTRSILNASRSKVQRGIKDGRVSVNDSVVTRASYAVQPGDRIVCRILRSPPIVAVPQPIPLDIIFEDDWLIVVNKAAGMVVHPAYGNRDGTLVNALLHHVGASAVSLDEEANEDEDAGLSLVNAFPERPGDVSVRPGIVHRLDKDTSGLLVVAKDDVTHADLAGQFSARTIGREYVGLVWGVPDPAEGRIDRRIGRDPRDRKRMAVVRSGGKEAATTYRLLESFGDSSMISFRLETGRTHQIRVHATSVGHPILGDETYGGRDVKRWGLSRVRRATYSNILDSLTRQALHARSIHFVHPKTRELVSFESPLPGDMADAVERLKRAS